MSGLRKKTNFIPPPIRSYAKKCRCWSGWFYEEVYRANVHVIWPATEKTVEEFIKWHFRCTYTRDGKGFGGTCIHLETPDGKVAEIIALASFGPKPDDTELGILAHEVFHCADHILSGRGVTLNGSTSEQYAFLIESLMRRCIQILRP